MKFRHLLFLLPFFLLLMANDCGGDDCKNHCNNGKKDCGEEDVDCGGEDCEPCITCDNLVKDGDEEGVDCGGSNCEPCREVDRNKELVIVDLGVVNSDEAKPGGAFHIGTLLRKMEGNGITAKSLMLDLLNSFGQEQTINGFKVPARTRVKSVKDAWKAVDGFDPNTPDEDWEMNFDNAPFTFLAITNRLDLSSPEGRLVYSVNASGPFTVIFEYGLPLKEELDTVKWALKWHELTKHDNFDDAFVANLVEVVEGFTGSGSSPEKVNGNSINQIRTNEFLQSPWELREFNLTETGLKEATRKMTPDNSSNNSPALINWLTENAEAILANDFEVPEKLADGANFLSGNVPVNFGWTASGVNNQVRDIFALNTCNGCHERETGTSFLHFTIRRPDQPSVPSKWMRETDIPIREAIMIKDFLQMTESSQVQKKSMEMQRLLQREDLRESRKSRIH